MKNLIFTYRNGERIYLEKSMDSLVIRELPEKLNQKSIPEGIQVSGKSTKITTTPDNLENLMSRAREFFVAHHSYKIPGTSNDFLITDRVFIKFQPETSLDEKNVLLRKYKLVIHKIYEGGLVLCRLTNETGMNPIKLVVRLTEDENLEYAELDLNYTPTLNNIPLPSDTQYLRQWHLHTRFNHSDYHPRASSLVEDAWIHLGNFGSNDVVIAVTDDGCDMNHKDFSNPEKMAGWGRMEQESFFTFGDTSRMYKRGFDHGTSCAGVSAAEIDGTQTVGAAPNAKLFPVMWESGNEGGGTSLFVTDSKFLTILESIGNRVDIISNSWGTEPYSIWGAPVVEKVTELSTSGGRRGNGILFLFAAGNANCPLNYDGNIEVPFSSSEEGGSLLIHTSSFFRRNLSHLPNVMFVGAISSRGQRSHYSNYGDGLSICAPSSNSHVFWRLFVRGLGITTTKGPDSIDFGFGGTSSATPLVAGVAGLVLSANPGLSANDLATILKRSASKDLLMEGYQKLDVQPDGSTWDVSPVPPFDSGHFRNIGSTDGTWSPWFGHGKVDALAAVRMAEQWQSTPEIPEEPVPPVTPPTPPDDSTPPVEPPNDDATPPEIILPNVEIEGEIHFNREGISILRNDRETTAQGGRNRKALAMRLNLRPNIDGLDLEYMVNNDRDGNSAWTRAGNLAGSGRNRICEFRIRLTGENAEFYDVEYKARIKRRGTTGWKRNGEACGSPGGRRMEMIRVRVLRK